MPFMFKKITASFAFLLIFAHPALALGTRHQERIEKWNLVVAKTGKGGLSCQALVCNVYDCKGTQAVGSLLL